MNAAIIVANLLVEEFTKKRPLPYTNMWLLWRVHYKNGPSLPYKQTRGHDSSMYYSRSHQVAARCLPHSFHARDSFRHTPHRSAMSIAKYIFKIPGVEAVVSRAAKAYQASVGAELRKYGLRYDDLLNEFDDEVKQAIASLPPQELEMRNKRLKRAIDLDLKKTYLPQHLQDQQDIWNPYLSTRVKVLKQKKLERQIVE